MECRTGCAACCIAPSIVQAIPNMPEGKAAGERCANLDPETLACKIWETDDYPELCRAFQPDPAFCGSNRSEALQILNFVEAETSS
jgi:hypothetical protein